MLPGKIQQSTFLDILFENRNRQYGAYPLRLYYHVRLTIALITTICLAGILCLILKVSATHDDFLPVHAAVVELSPIGPFRPDPPPPPPPAVKPKPSVPAESMIRDLVPVVVPETSIIDPVPTIDEKNMAVSGNETRVGEPDAVNTGLVKDASLPGNGSEVKPEISGMAPAIFDVTNVEEQADFPGGREGLARYLKRNLVNPAIEENKLVHVLVRFVVGPGGEIAGVSVINSGGNAYDQEVMRVVKKMPRWKPAKQHGQQVSMYFALPVTFASITE